MFRNTNVYAHLNAADKPTYVGAAGHWKEASVEEFERLLGLLIYMGLVQVPSLYEYWATKPLFHGLWARSFMSRDRFQRLMAFLHIDDPRTEDDPGRKKDKLKKVRTLIDALQAKCQQLYTPERHVSIDERMIKAKGVCSFR